MEEYSFDQSDIEQIEAERDEQADRERAEAAAKVTKEQEEAKQNVAAVSYTHLRAHET